MEIISHFDDVGNYIGYTFDGDLIKIIIVDRIVIDQEDGLELEEDMVTFITLEGNVIYKISDFKRFNRRGDGFYFMNLKEDQRG